MVRLRTRRELRPGENAIPADLFDVMTWARRQGCEYILFDCNADQVDGLPAYDW
ncbi:hypothetical protein [Mesorhizobium sp.]|uniref:DUF5983 family protein n=1 Tax=Mesorhizobium sp. TaxID=1871066 RepID=UPI0025DE0B7B|nr:hypothetical protein [Mesorhizobium sp.]